MFSRKHTRLVVIFHRAAARAGRLLLPVLVPTLLAACGAAAPPDKNDPLDSPDMSVVAAALPDLAPPPPDMATRPYPAGPYGVAVGDTLADFVGKGYPLSLAQTDYTLLTYGPVHLSLLTQNPACKCILISESAEWCGPCNKEQPDLVAAVAKMNGLCVYEVLLQGYSQAKPAVKGDVDDWAGIYNHNFPVVIPGPAGINRMIPTTPGIPTNVVVDPATMKILEIWDGYDPAGAGPHALMTCAAK